MARNQVVGAGAPCRLLAFFVFGLAACSSKSTTGPNVVVAARVTLAPVDTTIPPGASFQLRTAVVDSAGNPIAGVQPTLSVADTIIATVTAQGVLQATNDGITIVTAAYKALAAQAAITVRLRDTLIARTSLAGRPYALAVASTGVAYVGQLDVLSLSRLNLPATTFSATVAVGNIPTEVAFNSSGTTAFVTNQSDNTVGIVDVATNTETSTIAVTGNPFDVLVAPGDSILYVTTNVDSLYAIRTATPHTVIARFYTSGALANGLATHDSTLYVTTRAGGTVLQINLNTNTLRNTFAVGGSPQGIVVSANGKELYIANENSRLQFWNVAGDTSDGSVIIAGPGFGLAMSPATGYLYVTTEAAGVIQIVNPRTHVIAKTFTVGGTTRRIAFNPSGSIGAVANEGGWVDFFN